MIYRLRQEPLVERAKYHSEYLSVKFTNGIFEKWWKNPNLSLRPEFVMPYDPNDGKPITIGMQYETNPLDDDYDKFSKMFILRYKDWKKGSFYEKRMSIHRLIDKVFAEGFQPLNLSQEELRRDLDALIKCDVLTTNVFRDTILVFGATRVLGRRLCYQLTPWANYLAELWTHRSLYHAIRRLFRRYKDITRFSLMHSLAWRAPWHDSGRFYIPPTVYMAILRRFEISGQVIADPNPGCWSKAIGTSLCNCVYCAPSAPSSLGEFLGVEFNELSREHYDCVWLDYNWIPQDKQKILDDLRYWNDLADAKIVFVPRQYKDILPKPLYRFDVRILPDFLGYIYYYL